MNMYTGQFLGFLAALALLAAPLPVLAEEEDDSTREEEMFGSEEEASGDREDEMFGEETGDKPGGSVSTGQRLAEKLEETDDPLSIGGELYMRLSYNIMDEGSFDEHTLQSPNLLHLYLDVRPNDRVRGFARGRLFFDPTIEDGSLDAFGQEQTRLDAFLDQLWLKFDIAHRVYVTVGRQAARWGSGRFWNPTDFLNQQRRDPLAIFDERLGVTLVKVHVPVESLGWNFYAVANLDGAQSLEDVGGAFRGEFLFGETEVAASVAMRKDNPLRLGLDVSSAIGDFDVRLEGAVVHDDDRPFYRGELRLEGADPSTWVFPEEYTREDDWIPQVTAGAEVSILYTEQDSFTLGVEYFYNDAGGTDTKLFPWLFMEGQYTPFYVGKHYVSGYLMFMQPGDWNDTTFFLSGIANLSDGTGVVRFDYQVLLLTYLQLAAYVSVYTGDTGEFHYQLDVPPIPAIPELEDGMHIPAQRVQLGLWLTLKV